MRHSILFLVIFLLTVASISQDGVEVGYCHKTKNEIFLTVLKRSSYLHTLIREIIISIQKTKMFFFFTPTIFS